MLTDVVFCCEEAVDVVSDLLDALIEELKAGVAVADEGALLDELSEHLSPRQLAVKLLLRSIPRLQKTCRTRRSRFID